MGKATKKEIVQGKDLKGLLIGIQPKDSLYVLTTYENELYKKYHIKAFIFHRFKKEFVDVTEDLSNYLGTTFSKARPIDGGEIALNFTDSLEKLIESFGEKAFNDPKSIIYKNLRRMSNY